MPSVILGIADYDAIRIKLGVTVDDLPNSELDSLAVLQVADAFISDMVPTYTAIIAGGGHAATYLKAAEVCFAAALAIDGLIVKRGQRFRLGSYSEYEAQNDFLAFQDRLRSECGAYLILMDPTSVPPLPKILVAGGPTSGGTSWPAVIDQWFARIQPHYIAWLRDGGLHSFSWIVQP